MKYLPDILSPDRGLIFRITHIDNLQTIAKQGLVCRSRCRSDSAFRSIGNPDVIERRRNRAVPEYPGGVLDDYVPFYFTPRSPMLLNIKTGRGVEPVPMQEILCLIAKLEHLRARGHRIVIADGNAASAETRFSTSIDSIRGLDWVALRASNFQKSDDDPDLRRRYMAEALIHEHVAFEDLTGIAVAHDQTEAAVRDFFESLPAQPTVAVRPHFFFEPR